MLVKFNKDCEICKAGDIVEIDIIEYYTNLGAKIQFENKVYVIRPLNFEIICFISDAEEKRFLDNEYYCCNMEYGEDDWGRYDP